MTDLFDNIIICKNCNIKMKRASLIRNGFELRAMMCERCGNKIIHPQDEKEFEQFNQLKNKTFRVKMRIVGNSYAVSIPKEIVDFMHEQEKMMDDMVRLVFNDAKRLSLSFGENFANEKNEREEIDSEQSEDSLTPSHKRYAQDVREIARRKIRRQAD